MCSFRKKAYLLRAVQSARKTLDVTSCVQSGFLIKKKIDEKTGLGLKPRDPRTKESVKRWKNRRKVKGYDTAGASALDKFGNLASATSTGGRGFERPGRVSDSAMPAANYANNLCAISATGIGEEIIDEGLAVKIAARVQDGFKLSEAFKKTFREARTRKRSFGAVGLDSKGNAAYQATTEILLWAWQKGKSQYQF